MEIWYSISLGDGIISAVPAAEIEGKFRQLFAAAGEPVDMAVFTRLESENRLHCEMTAYFSPAARDLARAFGARPCVRPARAGLDLLAGNPQAWSALFSEHEG